MAKVYSKSKKEIMWEDQDGLFCLLEEAMWDAKEVLELRGGSILDEYTLWLYKAYHRMEELLKVLNEENKEYSLDELLDRELIAEKE